MNKFVFLSDAFYNYHREQNHTEIEQKADRPYIQVCVTIDGIQYTIPMRSHISHNHVLWTNKADRCGLDFSKAVVIENEDDVDNKRKPYVRNNEFASLIGKEYIIETKMRSFIKKYKKAKENPNVPRNKNICQFSTLQYFEEYLDKHEG